MPTKNDDKPGSWLAGRVPVVNDMTHICINSHIYIILCMEIKYCIHIYIYTSIHIYIYVWIDDIYIYMSRLNRNQINTLEVQRKYGLWDDPWIKGLVGFAGYI